MKEIYSEAEIELIRFAAKDILTESGTGAEGGSGDDIDFDDE